jgi:hypothetical protein
MKWLPEALKSGRSKWDNLHPRIKRLLVERGYDKNGNKVR